MNKDIRMLSIKVGTPSGDAFVEWLSKFGYRELIECPNVKPEDFRRKGKYSKQEQKILNYLHNVESNINLCSPIVCSGLRGDGSKYKEKCKYFRGYGWNKDKLFNFDNPQIFIQCTKAKRGKVPIKLYASNCELKRLALVVAKKKKLVYEWGCADLENTPIEDCLMCEYKTESSCEFESGCKKGEIVLGLFTDCTIGVCKGCRSRNK